MTYQEAITYFQQIQTGAKIRPGLTVIRTLMEHLGNPQERLLFIHVAGTNGKGSTASFISMIYAESGRKVGRFVSPSVFGECEKIQYVQAGETVWISEEEMAACLTEIRIAIEEMQESGEGVPTEFEIDTAAAFLAFDRWNCDLVVLETGMGGSLDATNMIRKTACAVITPIAMDHMSFLGNTLREIATQKAGIIKEKTPVVTCQHEPEAYECLAEAAREKDSVIRAVSDDEIVLHNCTLKEICFDYKTHRGLRLTIPGIYQVENACLALECVEMLQSRFEVSEKHIRDGLARTVWKGRFEVLREEPPVIADGAHNLDGLRHFLASADAFLKERMKIGIMGVFADKDSDAMTELLGECFQTVYTVTPPSGRGLPAERLAEKIGDRAVSCHSVTEAVERARSEADEKNAALLIFGSLSILKEVYADFSYKK